MMYELEVLILGGVFLSAGIFFAVKAIQHKKETRSVKKLFGKSVLDTSKEWLYFTSFLGLAAIGAHVIAEFSLHLYDTTPVDRFTHGLSGMAVTAIMLNLNLGTDRKKYYLAAIGFSLISFILWEIFEGVFYYVNPSGLIQVDPWDAAIDVWIDFLGGLAVCFLSDEFTS